MNSDRLKAAMDMIYLVSCAVNSEKPEKEICAQMDLSELYRISLDHALTEASAYALEQVTSLPEDFKEAKYKAIRRLSLLNIERERIKTELEKHEIWYLPLKGIVLKGYYPKTAMREMSDNDILCDSEKMAEIKLLMEGLGFVCTHCGKNHHDVYEKSPRLCFEMHRSFFNQNSHPDQFDYFEKLKDKKIKDSDNQYGYHLSNEDFYIYLLTHMYNQYRSKGTGLRSLLDIYVFYKKFGTELDFDYLVVELKKLGLVEFEQGIRELAFKVYSRQSLSDKELSELEFLIESGAQGSMDNFLMFKLDNDDSSDAKKKYLLERVFPPRESLKSTHPLVYRHKALYPFWIAYRPIKGALTRPKRIFREVKRVKRFKKKNNSGIYNK